MTEKHIVLDEIDPVVFYGVNNGHLQIIKSLYPKLRIVARGNVIRVLGDQDEMNRFEDNIEKMRRHVLPISPQFRHRSPSTSTSRPAASVFTTST